MLSVVAQVVWLERCGQLGLGVGADLRIVRKRQAVGALTAGKRLEAALVVAQFGQRHLATDGHSGRRARLRAGDVAALAG